MHRTPPSLYLAESDITSLPINPYWQIKPSHPLYYVTNSNYASRGPYLAHTNRAPANIQVLQTSTMNDPLLEPEPQSNTASESDSSQEVSNTDPDTTPESGEPPMKRSRHDRSPSPHESPRDDLVSYNVQMHVILEEELLCFLWYIPPKVQYLKSPIVFNITDSDD